MVNSDKPGLKMIREFVAVGRAGFDRPHTPQGDPNAQAALVQGIEIKDDHGVPLEVSGPLVELLAPRAPFFDQGVLDALAAGVAQIVNIGAGYDDRALRFRHPGVTFFELDLPHVIADKARRLAVIADHQSQPILLPVDLRTDDVAGRLRAAGLELSKPTLFICEHVLLFLEGPAVRRLLHALSRVAAPGSSLALSIEVHPDGPDTHLVLATVDETMFANAGLLHSISTRRDWNATLTAAGWNVDQTRKETAVDHFVLPVAGQEVQIQTQFITASVPA